MQITFTWIDGATWILDVQGARIACDPVLCPAGTVQNYGFFTSRRLSDPVFTDDDLKTVDLWLITHGHEDHLDREGLAHISKEAKVITHPNAVKFLKKAGLSNLSILRWGEQQSYTIQDISVTIEAVPAIHGPNPFVALFAGGVNGYWLTLTHREESRSVYITSDTVLHSKVLQAIQGRRTDLLVPNMGAVKQDNWMGPLTLSADMLKELMKTVQPTMCIPVHFGTFEHYVEPISIIEQWNDERIIILQPGQKYHIV